MFIIAGISMLVSGGLLFYLQKGMRAEPETDAIGQMILKPHWIYNITAYLGIFVALVFIVSGFISQELEFIIITLLMFVLFGIMGVYLFLLYRNHKVAFDEETISIRDLKGNTELIKWDEILKIKRDIWSSSIVLLDGNRKLKIYMYNVGFNSFVKMMEKKTEWRAKSLKIPFN